MPDIIKIKDVSYNWSNIQFAEYNKEKNVIVLVGIGWSTTFASQINPGQNINVRLTAEEFDTLKDYVLNKVEGYKVI